MMNCDDSTSSMVVRTMRRLVEVRITPMVTAGMISDCGPMKPDGGSQRSVTEKISTSMMPSQKLGKDSPARDSTRTS